MPVADISDFFKWCSLINGLLLLVSTVYVCLAGDFVYRQQRRLFPISRDQFTLFIYGFLGIYKLLWIVLNVVPFIALQVIASH